MIAESTQHVGPGGRTLLPFSPIKPRKQLLSIKQEQKHLGAGFLYSLQSHSNELFSMQILKHCFVLGKGFVARYILKNLFCALYFGILKSSCQLVVVHTFNPSTWEAQVGRSL